MWAATAHSRGRSRDDRQRGCCLARPSRDRSPPETGYPSPARSCGPTARSCGSSAGRSGSRHYRKSAAHRGPPAPAQHPLRDPQDTACAWRGALGHAPSTQAITTSTASSALLAMAGNGVGDLSGLESSGSMVQLWDGGRVIGCHFASHIRFSWEISAITTVRVALLNPRP